MPAAFDRCVENGGRVRTKKLKDDKYIKVCFLKGKSYAGEVHKKKESVKWTSDIITESLKENDQIIEGVVKVKGTAIKARESRNGIVYEMTELSKAMESLRGKSIALNHSENAEDVVGTIESVHDTGDGLDYEAKVFNTGRHPYVIELLQKGLIRHVSIEANAPKLEEVDGKRVARNLEFLGLGFVRHPGIPEASASIAEALEKVDVKEQDDEDSDDIDDEEVEDTDEAMHGKDHDKKMDKMKKKHKKDMPEDEDEEIDDEKKKKMKKMHGKSKEELEQLKKEIVEISSHIHELLAQIRPSEAIIKK